MKDGKMVVWGDFTNAEERREEEAKGERERYTQLNAEFQRIAKKRQEGLLK